MIDINRPESSLKSDSTEAISWVSYPLFSIGLFCFARAPLAPAFIYNLAIADGYIETFSRILQWGERGDNSGHCAGNPRQDRKTVTKRIRPCKNSKEKWVDGGKWEVSGGGPRNSSIRNKKPSVQQGNEDLPGSVFHFQGTVPIFAGTIDRWSVKMGLSPLAQARSLPSTA